MENSSQKLLPSLVLVGRPNVGKSTLFNRLTRSKNAIVANIAGLTRDRHYGIGKLAADKLGEYLVIDTGGFEPLVKEGILSEMAKQTEQAILEGDAILFLVDARNGITPHDKEIAAKLRRLQQERPVIVAINKSEGLDKNVICAEFYELGLGKPFTISATHGDGVRNVLDCIFKQLKQNFHDSHENSEKISENLVENSPVKVAIVGRPNVGKSTLINALLGENRVIAYDLPGTTRDAIEIEFNLNNKNYVLVDTAGMRKRGKVFESIEKFSVIKTLQAIENCNVAILLIDAQADISDQDAHIADFIIQSGRALVVAVNKWDGLSAYEKQQIKIKLGRKLQFLNFAETLFISALKSNGLKKLFTAVDAAYTAAMTKIPTPKITRVLQDAIARQAPARVAGGIRPKPKYAHQGGSNPPIIVLHGNSLDELSPSYLRYLENTFREVFRLQGTPLQIQCVNTNNPYDKDKENKNKNNSNNKNKSAKIKNKK